MNRPLEVSAEEMKKILENAPPYCLITGMKKCESYLIDGNVVYLPTPAYDAYTLPEYDEQEMAFYHTKYDMDNDFISENQHLCELAELENHSNITEIKSFYKIS